MATRFATLNDIGEYKPEEFWPAGGGMDDASTLAHVTIAHAIDADLLSRLAAHPCSYLLAMFDLQSHVGRHDQGGIVVIGKVPESKYRHPRSACGAIQAALNHYDLTNMHHVRIRGDLGEENYEYLTREGIRTPEGIDIAPAVASAIIAVTGMDNTVQALAQELGERGVAHLTASDIVNRASAAANVILLAKATMANGTVIRQGFGTDAQRYAGWFIDHAGEKRLVLVYDGNGDGVFEPMRTPYQGKKGQRQ
jgi:hypothetical protein